jgi:hypothetical protein
MIPPAPNLEHPALVLTERSRDITYWPGDYGQRGPGPTWSLVELEGTDLLLPMYQWVYALGGDLPVDILLRLDFDGSNTTCGELRFLKRPDRPAPMSATNLRRVPLDSLMRAASDRRTTYTLRGGTPIAIFGDGIKDEYRQGLAELARRERQRTPDSDLERAAAVYRSAAAAGEPPTAAVERELRLKTRDQAKKWVQRARRAGYLPPATGERVGGVTGPIPATNVIELSTGQDNE